jgi:hypothetical protein
LQTIEDFARKSKLPKDLEIRMKRFLQNNQNDQELGSEEFAEKVISGLKKLPASLRSEIVDHTHADIIQTITFF